LAFRFFYLDYLYWIMRAGSAVSAAVGRVILQKNFGLCDGFGKANPFDGDIGGKGGCQSRWQTAIEHHKYTAVGLPADQPAKGLP
jgi:hypothetical protein